METDETVISMEISFSCLRLLQQCVEKCYQNWSGGHPGEQVALDELRTSLRGILLEAIYDDRDFD